jgi:transposase-like protein
MRCLIEKVVRFPRAETVRLTGPTELDLTVPDQAKFVICNHTIEQDHRFVTRRVNPGLGFGPFATAQRTIQGYEAMHMLRKGQIKGIAKRDVLAQNCVINQLFGLVA